VNIHWTHCIENFFTVQHFWTTCTCPEKQRFPWNFYFFGYLIFIIQDFCAICACLKKQIWPEILHFIEIILSFRIFEQLALALKNRVYLEFTYWMHIFYHSGFEELALALKNRVALKFFTVLKYFFINQEFWATCPYSENRVCPGIFHWIEIFFINQEFWATCACPENIISPENFQAGGRQSPRHPSRTPMGLWYRAVFLNLLKTRTIFGSV